jgi:hypothetical protein
VLHLRGQTWNSSAYSDGPHGFLILYKAKGISFLYIQDDNHVLSISYLILVNKKE